MALRHSESIFIFLLACAGTAAVQGDPFFWDTVQLGSKHAHFFYENGLRWSILPEAIDSGHPPFLGYYIAVCWKLFGKSLYTSHWAMFPFVWLNLYMVWRLARRISDSKLVLFVFAVLIADPVWTAQHLLCSPDVPVFSGFMLVLYGHFERNQLVRVAGALLLSVGSMRGMMIAAALGVWELLLLAGPLFSFRLAARVLAAYIPGGVMAATFLLWHLGVAGWTGFHPASPWASAFQQTDLTGMARNMLVTGWRWLDFGRVGLWILFGWLLWLNRARIRSLIEENREWFLLTGCLLLFLTPSAIIYRNLSAHRYFLPVFFSFSLLVVAILAASTVISEQKKRIIALLAALVLLSGHYWIYPFGISNDWDCTLVHREFHALRRDAVSWLNNSGADFSEVGTEFPVLNSGEMTELNGDKRMFSEYIPGKSRWVLISNISNDFSQETERNLAESTELAWEKHAGHVWIKIYRTTDSAESR